MQVCFCTGLLSNRLCPISKDIVVDQFIRFVITVTLLCFIIMRYNKFIALLLASGYNPLDERQLHTHFKINVTSLLPTLLFIKYEVSIRIMFEQKGLSVSLFIGICVYQWIIYGRTNSGLSSLILQIKQLRYKFERPNFYLRPIWAYEIFQTDSGNSIIIWNKTHTIIDNELP